MIRYVTGDATEPQATGTRVIVHICNDVGAWGAGFVLAVSKRWQLPEYMYRSRVFRLGEAQIVQVEPDLYVANMIAQRGFPTLAQPVAVDYVALEKCLNYLAAACNKGTSFHMPRIGCGIAGGQWHEVERIIERKLGDFDVTVYDLPRGVL